MRDTTAIDGSGGRQGHDGASTIAVVGVDEGGTIVHASPGIASLLGWDPGDLIGTPLRALIPDRFRGPHGDGFSRFAKTGDLRLVGRTLALPALDAHGVEREIELVLSMPSRNDPAAVIGVLRPPASPSSVSTAQTQHALEMVLSDEAQFGDALEASLQLVAGAAGWTVATLWIVDFWSDALRAVAFWEAEPGANASYLQARAADLVTRDESIPGQVWAAGTARWFRDVASEAVDDPVLADRAGSALFHPLLHDNDVVGVLELVDDDHRGLTVENQESLWALADQLARFVARRAQRERADAERQRVQLALSARGMGVWTHQVSTGQVIWDEQMERLHGFEPGTFGGEFDDYSGRIHPDDRSAVIDQISRAVEQGDRFDYQCRVRRLDGSEAWLEGSGLPILDSNGRLVELTGVCYDITADVRAREELEERVRHAALAADVGRAFVGDETIDEKLQLTAEAMVEHLDAAFARIWVLPPGEDVLELRASAGLYTHLDGEHSRVRVGELKIGQIAAEMQPHLTNDVSNDERISDAEWARREGMQAFAGYPLVVGDRRVGVLALFAQRTLEPTALRALGAIADTVAIGIDQARAAEQVLDLYEQSRRHAEAVEAALLERARVAEVLQQSLLPPSLPELEGYALEARYRAGIEEVGGDFYDVFPLSGDRWAIMVGDICGRGPEAARFTALARHSLRMALMLGHAPADALAALNAALLRSDNDGRFCTAICGIVAFDGGASTIDLAIAGHPPAIVMRNDGSVEEVYSTGTLMGVFVDATFGQSTVRLESDEALVLYTDGVTEARRGDQLLGVEGLTGLLGGLSSREPKIVVDAIFDTVTTFEGSGGDDDLAVVVIQRT